MKQTYKIISSSPRKEKNDFIYILFIILFYKEINIIFTKN